MSVFALRALYIVLCNIPTGAVGFGDAITLYILLNVVGSPSSTSSSQLSEAVFLLTCGGLGSTLTQGLLTYQHANLRLVGVLLPPVLALTWMGLTALFALQAYTLLLKHVLGALFLCVAVFKVRQEVHKTLQEKKLGKEAPDLIEFEVCASPRVWFPTMFAGCFAGFLAGLFGTGGMPLMVWITMFPVEKDEWRATQAIVWAVTNVLRFLYFEEVAQEIELSRDALMVLGLSIAGGVGVVIGGLLSKVISPQWFRRCIVLLLVMGANTMIFAGGSWEETVVAIIISFLLIQLYAYRALREARENSGTFASLKVRHSGGYVYSAVKSNDEV